MQNKYKSLRNTEKFVANRDFNRAIREYKRLLETDGEDPAILNTLGDLLLRNNRKDEALGNFRRVAEIYEESGFIAKAIAVCNKIAKLNPGERLILQKLVDLNKRRGHRFEAARFLSQLVQERRDAGDLNEAISYQKQILEIDSSNPKFNLEAAELLTETGETGESTQYFVSAGRAFLAKGKTKEALEAGKQALRSNNDSREAQLLLTDAERMLENEEGVQSPPHDLDDFQETEPIAAEESLEDEIKVEEISELDFSDLSYDEVNEPEELETETPVQEEQTETVDFDFSMEPEADTSDEGTDFELESEEVEPDTVSETEDDFELDLLTDQEDEIEEVADQVEEIEKDSTEETEEIEDISVDLPATSPELPDFPEPPLPSQPQDPPVISEPPLPPTVEEIEAIKPDESSQESEDSSVEEGSDLELPDPGVQEPELETEPEDEVEQVEEIETSEEPAEKSFQERLDEVDFYLKLDLKEDARRTIDGLLEDFPGNEDVLKRQESMDADPTGSKGESKTETDFEIEAALDDLFEGSAEEQSLVTTADEVSLPDEASSDDPKAQLDLGVAYREMGMFEDAVEKFEEAFSSYETDNNEEESVRCSSLLSSTHLQLGHYRDTIQWADRGLGFSEIKSFERKTLEFDRAQAFELLGEFDESLKSYRKVFKEDPDFRDVQARISRIELLSD